MNFQILGPLEVWAYTELLKLGGSRKQKVLSILPLNARLVSRCLFY